MILNHLLELYYMETNSDLLLTHEYFNNPNNLQFLESIYPCPIEWAYLSSNINGPHILKFYMDKINWSELAANPNAYDILVNNLDKIKIDRLAYNINRKILDLVKWDMDNIHIFHGEGLFSNPSALHLIEPYLLKNIDNYTCDIFWFDLSRNPNAIHLLKQYPEKIYWKGMCENKNPKAIKLISKYEFYLWVELSTNPNAIDLLLDNPKEIFWYAFSSNTNDRAIEILQDHNHLIEWGIFSYNPNPMAVKLMENNIENINWRNISANPSAANLLIKYPLTIYWENLCLNPTVWEKQCWSPSTHKYFTPVQRHSIVVSYKFLITLVPQEIAYAILSYY